MACFFWVRSRAATAPATTAPVPMRVLNFTGAKLGLRGRDGKQNGELRRKVDRRWCGRFALMALVPIPSTNSVAAAAGNVAHKLLYGGLADLRPMPRTLIDEGILREVYHYRPLAGVEQIGDPILLVTPLAAPSSCFDLRRGCSLVEHLLQQGRPVYLVEYGEVSFRN